MADIQQDTTKFIGQMYWVKPKLAKLISDNIEDLF